MIINKTKQQNKFVSINVMTSFCYDLYNTDDVISNIILHASNMTLFVMVISH